MRQSLPVHSPLCSSTFAAQSFLPQLNSAPRTPLALAVLGYGGCKGARKMGFDSIQLPLSYGGHANELIDCRAEGQPGSDDVWELACPPPHVELRLGIPPLPRYAPHIPNETAVVRPPACACQCDVGLSHLNCNQRQDTGDLAFDAPQGI